MDQPTTRTCRSAVVVPVVKPLGTGVDQVASVRETQIPPTHV